MRNYAGVLIMLLLLTGCWGGSDESSPVIEPSAAEIALTPVDDLFEGDAAKFKLFLGTMSGAFKLAYEGEKPSMKLDLDIWRGGKRVDKAGSIGDVFHSTQGPTRKEVEVLIAIDDSTANIQNGQVGVKVCLVDEEGASLSTFTIPWDPKLTARGLIAYTEPRTFTLGEAISVFGMHATSTNSILTADFSAESLGSTEWALVLTLRPED
ncbi:hypothetical protein [Paenibacillus methanolicus]|uniref:Lipoprotein n=1 Tax=Paenibacillus methanolicus TaxID=582686 RepID=A0A5S5C899_9BACL|nr:hypothetical protein [Paenibacillus methanolicus]TYP74712.1 hypothetical protein BCM02_105256 [Paenibacillus methanolicus]